jgi:hypothetical protein
MKESLTVLLIATLMIICTFLNFKIIKFEGKIEINKDYFEFRLNNLEDQIDSIRKINQRLLIKDHQYYGTTSTDNESNE